MKTTRERLDQKFQLYHDLVKTQQDWHGFIQTDECDALLFSALLGCVPGIHVKIEAAQKPSGQWHRRPFLYPPCYPYCSKSTISRDMLLGLAWFALVNKRLDISEGVIKYALSHWLKMGEGDLSRVMISPALLATFAKVSSKLGGPKRPWLTWIPVDTSAELDGYQAHLRVLHVLLRKKLGEKRKSYDSALKYQARKQPWNPLFQFAAGKVDTAIALLADELSSIWPENRLPTTADRKEPWIFQRDFGEDWEPATNGLLKKHSGGDFLFLWGLVRGLI